MDSRSLNSPRLSAVGTNAQFHPRERNRGRESHPGALALPRKAEPWHGLRADKGLKRVVTVVCKSPICEGWVNVVRCNMYCGNVMFGYRSGSLAISNSSENTTNTLLVSKTFAFQELFFLNITL